jgi:hypothetical protein
VFSIYIPSHHSSGEKRISNICLDVRFGRGVAVSFCLTKAALSSTTIADK